MKFLYEQSSTQMPEAHIISFFFNARGGQLEKTTLGLYRALLWNIFRVFDDLTRVLVDVSVDYIKTNGWREQHLQNLFQQTIGQLGDRPLVCYIDALDECAEEQVRDMVRYFQKILEATESGSYFKICLSSRLYPNITIGNSFSLVLEDHFQRREDIRRYIDSELIRQVDRVDQEQAMRIQNEIVRKSSGVFLYVKLVIDMIKKAFDHGKADAHALEQLLAKLPRGLNALYCDMLERNPEDSEDPEDKEATRLCFQWILFAGRPLDVAELYYAIRFGLNNDIVLRYDESRRLKETMRRYILSVSKGFVEETKKSDPRSTSTMQFIRESVRDFFLGPDGRQSVWKCSSGSFEGECHDALKKLCYKGVLLTACEVERGRWSRRCQPIRPAHDLVHWIEIARSNRQYSFSQNGPKFNPFLVYTIYGSLNHAEKAQSLGIQQQGFISDFSIDTWLTVRNCIFPGHDERDDVDRITYHDGPTHTSVAIDHVSQFDAKMLYILVMNNCPHLVRIHPGRENHMEFDGGRYGPPLIAAIINGHREVAQDLGIQVFLDQKLPISIDERDKKYFGSLGPRQDVDLFHNMFFSLVSLDCVSALKALAIQGEDFNQIYFSYTPLSCAIIDRAINVIDWLLGDPRVNINGLDRGGRTPFAHAIRTGYLKIAKVLLATGSVDPDSKDYHGRTPLSSLIRSNVHESEDVPAVEWLLSLDEVDPNHPDNDGRTPVSHVLEWSRPAVLEIFIRFGCGRTSPEQDPYSSSPGAGVGKRTSVEIDFDSTDNTGQTPLRWASKTPNDLTPQMVRMLLDTDRVNPELKADDGLTPLDAFRGQLGGPLDERAKSCIEEIENYLCRKRRAVDRVEHY
ncbi:ankyrin [Hypoxylon sp. EC38]|nr:ankyrin [Hypoxylon sp. EC38]